MIRPFFRSLSLALVFIILLYLSALVLPRQTFAVQVYFDTPIPSNLQRVSADRCVPEPPECANSQNSGNCGLPACSGGQAWTKYQLVCAVDPEAPSIPLGYYERGGIIYSIGDKCTSGEPGLRSSSCTSVQSPSIYKTCCSNTSPSYVISDSRSGMGGANSCVGYCAETNSDGTCNSSLNPPYEGYCPAGSTEERCGGPGYPACGQEACGPLPPTCTAGTSYTQCGQTGGCTNNYASNHTVNITPSNCSDGTTTYSCSDAGVFPGQCGNALTCSVSFSLSNTNPPTNSTVNVSVTGNSSNAGWSNVAYSLDGGGWNSGVNVPNPGTPYYTFNVNSDSAGPHSLRFAVNNGSVVCSSSGLNSFTTQAPTDGSTCTAISINNGNPVFVGGTYRATASMRNDGTSIWTWNQPNPYRLGSQDPQDNTVWGLHRVDLPTSPIGPGSPATFNFNVSAPTTAGTYSFNWKMVHDGYQWFGQMCQRNVPVSVLPPSDFVPSCTGTVTNAQTRTVRWDAQVIPAGTYTYSWGGDASGTSASVTQTYATTGTKNAQVTVRNSSGTLRTSNNCSATIPAPFSYNLTNSGNISVQKTSSVSNTVTANLVSGTTQVVSFSATGFPSGVTGSFGPTSCNPTCSSILTMNASSTASTGTFPITVTGTSSNVTNQTTSFNLTVTAPATNPPGAFSQNAPSPRCNGTSPYVDLSWNTSANATSYEVYRNGSFTTGGLNQLSYRDSTVSPSTSYTYVIRARNSIGSIDSSNSRSATTLSCTSGSTPPPSSPSSGCAWIQTIGGDVHSNTGINTPCRP